MRCSGLVLGVVFTIASSIVGCAGDDESGSSEDHITSGKGMTKDDADAGASSKGALGAGAAFAPKEVVVLSDEGSDEDGETVVRARILAGTEPGICDRIDDGVSFNLKEG